MSCLGSSAEQVLEPSFPDFGELEWFPWKIVMSLV